MCIPSFKSDLLNEGSVLISPSKLDVHNHSTIEPSSSVPCPLNDTVDPIFAGFGFIESIIAVGLLLDSGSVGSSGSSGSSGDPC